MGTQATSNRRSAPAFSLGARVPIAGHAGALSTPPPGAYESTHSLGKQVREDSVLSLSRVTLLLGAEWTVSCLDMCVRFVPYKHFCTCLYVFAHESVRLYFSAFLFERALVWTSTV